MWVLTGNRLKVQYVQPVKKEIYLNKTEVSWHNNAMQLAQRCCFDPSLLLFFFFLEVNLLVRSPLEISLISSSKFHVQGLSLL